VYTGVPKNFEHWAPLPWNIGVADPEKHATPPVLPYQFLLQ